MSTVVASARRALVFGGTGTVGREVLRALAHAGVETQFTYRHSKERAKVLATEFEQTAHAVDLSEPGAATKLIATLDPAPDVFIHCAAIARVKPLAKATHADWDEVLQVNAGSGFEAAKALAAPMAEAGGGDIVFVGAIDRTQSFDLPAPFAASQGAINAMTMSLAHELGRSGVRVNQVALGVLDAGLSRELRPELLDDYKEFSALRRTGTAEEAARAIVWLALENSYMSGRILPVNGGI